MRLWYHGLISVLPTAQLKAMRYEIGDLVKQYPNIKNSLVKYVNNYDIKWLYSLFIDVLDEFDKRKINHNQKYDEEIHKIVIEKSKFKYNYLNLFYNEHNTRYLKQCLYNLQEKYDRGIISESEWQQIYDKFKDLINL